METRKVLTYSFAGNKARECLNATQSEKQKTTKFGQEILSYSHMEREG